jgi:signal peptidase II
MVWNPGISYGLFRPREGTVLLIGYPWWRWWFWAGFYGAPQAGLAIGYGLIIGGRWATTWWTAGLRQGGGFFHLHGFGYDWYVFNIADLAITLGLWPSCMMCSSPNIRRASRRIPAEV